MGVWHWNGLKGTIEPSFAGVPKELDVYILPDLIYNNLQGTGNYLPNGSPVSWFSGVVV